MNKTYYISYAVVLNTPRGIQYYDGKRILVKNQIGELSAKVNLEKYLKRKNGNDFIRLEIHDCVEDKFGLYSTIMKNRF